MITESGINFLKEINGSLTWENTGTLGIIGLDEVSDLYVKATIDPNVINLKYKISSGSLPVGLNLEKDGTICGKINSSLVSPNLTSETFNFSISAYVNYDDVLSEENFLLTVQRTTSTRFISIFAKPFLQLEQRQEISKLLNDLTIFEPKLLYRPNDSNFGLQTNLKFTIEFGAENIDLNYYEKLNENFSNRKILLGDFETTTYIKNNSPVYELIYIKVIDNLVNSKNISVADSFIFNNKEIFPPSIPNMKKKIKEDLEISNKQNPKFFDTENITYKMFVPIAYCLPNKSKIILNRLQNKNIKFNNINFEIDRLITELPIYFRFRT